MQITAEIFKAKVGSEPIQDDLQRCNCEFQGEFGHQQCGWCKTHDKPRFVCGCIIPLRS